jgi:hypothetical protein
MARHVVAALGDGKPERGMGVFRIKFAGRLKIGVRLGG